ncbi:MAG: hypothetical protein EPN97_07920 [Alphaproteobacteria bacterium]|nr:MAG: hypothetical protein EPN97_07920 [Alphaproteobacteria bacterium]
MGDRFDHYNSFDDAKIAREDRAADVKTAGPLFDAKTRAQIEMKLTDATRLPIAEVKDIVDTIDHLAGEPGANAKQIVTYAVAGHLPKGKDGFLKNLAGELEGVVNKSIGDREARIEALHATPSAPAPTVTSKNTLKV